MEDYVISEKSSTDFFHRNKLHIKKNIRINQNAYNHAVFMFGRNMNYYTYSLQTIHLNLILHLRCTELLCWSIIFWQLESKISILHSLDPTLAPECRQDESNVTQVMTTALRQNSSKNSHHTSLTGILFPCWYLLIKVGKFQ